MKERTTLSNQIEDRFVSLAADIITLVSRLPKNPVGRHIAGQLLRSGTATAANYGEARGAESRADFIHKLRIIQKELNETAIWLRILVKCSLVSPEQIANIVAENTELSRIITASIQTSRSRLQDEQ